MTSILHSKLPGDRLRGSCSPRRKRQGGTQQSVHPIRSQYSDDSNLREEKHTIKYPPAQPVTIIPIATDTLADPKTLPTTVGMVEKNPPLATPLIMTKSIKGATVFANGHNTSILSALVNRDSNSVLTGPIKSLKIPQPTRPTADAKLNPATKPAPALAERPNDTLYKGKKKGGTKRGKVAIAPARNRTRKRELRKSRLRRLVNETYSTPRMVGSNLPLNESSRCDRRTFFD
jgi:hypothetical protein